MDCIDKEAQIALSLAMAGIRIERTGRGKELTKEPTAPKPVPLLPPDFAEPEPEEFPAEAC